MQRKKVELLAPAGNPEGFYGAVHAGADAVYLGGARFGARAYADNFSEEELVECIRYAHIWGRRVYLTVNTLIKEEEFGELYGYLLPYYEAGLDGVIVQDLGALVFIREHFPGMELHASTQMTITGSYGAGWLKELGVCRIVPARELGLAEIKKMKQDTGLEMETFIHGAMCYCYSGQCLFSSILGGRSGNRGRCAQPCRLPYTVEMDGVSSRECYPLSLKDMCTIEHLPELIGAGIDSFKIEGRMKKPEYAAGVTAIYRKYIDAYYEHPMQKQRIDAEDLKELSCLYIRSERQDGYYFKHNGADMVTLDSPAYSGSDEALLARIRAQYLEHKPRIRTDLYAEFRLNQPARLKLVHDGICVCVEGDTVSAALRQPVTEENIAKQLRKLGDTVLEAGEMNILLDDNIFYPLKAINELRREAAARLEDELIRLNGLCVGRRALAGGDAEASCGGSGGEKEAEAGAEAACGQEADEAASRKALPGKPDGLSLCLRTPDQLKAAVKLTEEEHAVFSRVYLDGDLLLEGRLGDACGYNFQELVITLAQKSQVFAAMPYILRLRDEKYLRAFLHILSQKEFTGCMVRSLEGYAYLKDARYQGEIVLDSGMYLWNRQTLHFWQKRVSYYCLPLELNARELRQLLADQPGDLGALASPEKIVYGRIPMMITAGCIAKTTGRCCKDPSGRRQASLTDRCHKKFPVEINCLHCMNLIYNSVPLSLHTDFMKWKGTASQRLDFTTEDQAQTLAVIRYFMQLAEGKAQLQPPYAEYTKGHEKRGVE